MLRDQWVREPDFNIGIFGHKATSTKNKSIVNGIRYHNNIYKVLSAWQSISAPEHAIYYEPWLRNVRTRKMLQPDFVLVHTATNTAIVGEVKLNWKDGRDEKLIQHYLYAVESAFGVVATWPAIVTKNVAHLNREPRFGLGALLTVDDWQPGDPTPVLLVP